MPAAADQVESQGPSLLINDSKMLTALGFVADKVDVLSIPKGQRAALPVCHRSHQPPVATGGQRWRNGRGILFLGGGQ